MPQSTLKIFSKTPSITANDITVRLENMRNVADFKCEEDSHRKARYAMYKNIAKYEDAFKVLQQLVAPESEDLKKFKKEKFKLLKDHNADRKMHPELGEYLDPASVDDPVEFQRKLRELESTYQQTLEAEEQRQEENQRLGTMEIEDVPTPFKTSSENFPNSVTPRQLSKIAFMLEDDDE